MPEQLNEKLLEDYFQLLLRANIFRAMPFDIRLVEIKGTFYLYPEFPSEYTNESLKADIDYLTSINADSPATRA